MASLAGSSTLLGPRMAAVRRVLRRQVPHGQELGEWVEELKEQWAELQEQAGVKGPAAGGGAGRGGSAGRDSRSVEELQVAAAGLMEQVGCSGLKGGLAWGPGKQLLPASACLPARMHR